MVFFYYIHPYLVGYHIQVFVPMQVSNKSRFAEFKWKINFAQQLLSCHDFEKYKATGWRFSYLELYTNECIHTLEQKKKKSLWGRNWIISILSLLLHVFYLDHEENLEIKHGKNGSDFEMLFS